MIRNTKYSTTILLFCKNTGAVQTRFLQYDSNCLEKHSIIPTRGALINPEP